MIFIMKSKIETHNKLITSEIITYQHKKVNK